MTVKYIKDTIKNKIEIEQQILNDKKIISTIYEIANIITTAYKNSNKLIVAGNGGSAADTEHIVGELISRFNLERKALPAISLVSNFPVLTAIANDYGYETIFEKQIEGYAKQGDIYLTLSTSGNSKNIIQSLKKAKELEVITIGFTGANSCEMDNLCDYLIKIPSTETPIIQECHMMIGHIICSIVEKNIFS